MRQLSAVTVHDLPGPRALPLVGNLPQMLRGGTPHRVLQRWCDRYGPTFRVTFPAGPAVVTADPLIVDTVLRDRPDRFRRGARVTRIIDEAGVHGVFTAEGDEWRRLRRMATRSLNASYVRAYFTTLSRVNQRLEGRWSAAAAGGERIDVLDVMMRYTLDVTVGLTMGHDLNSLEHLDDGLQRRLPGIFPEIGRRLNAPLPYWRLFRMPRDRRLDAIVAELDELVRDRFEHARRRMATGAQPENFLEALVGPVGDEPSFTHEELFGNVLTMMLAGEDTTSSTAAWAIHYLAHDPDAQRRVRAEVDEVVGAGTVGDPETVRRLTYTEAVVLEAMRLRPVAPQLAVEPLQGTLVEGDGLSVAVQAGTPIIALTGYGARDETVFPNPGEFRPQRWLDGSVADRTHAPRFLPFGSGPRFCPGRNLAILEATLIAATTCRDFDIAPDTSAGPVGERAAFTVFPTNLRVTLARRPSDGAS
ncbi:Epi-isozizaene 5-monooxygenase/(E)-beta-farnesene synthase [Planotetraspora thailandica]|uniref:Epi-isozizaene 5-monooxygenase/(E)-beta-farnesene synthase n=1 Tax=Planotetraspora thailandica TaxID=487172 RepID=A0A8J3V2B1_9ACTN|nr:cytochrome P450 [Planotetraspora thailandica]GII52739.1 Epi-isozizaene 5-monooxygenase/(E)-beta-farnesene synthase [Planotetraspora thailandica]